MRIAILNFEQPWHVLSSTSLIRGYRNKYPNASISFFVDNESFSLLQYNKKISSFCGYTSNLQDSYDLAVNMSPSISACNFMLDFTATEKLGFIEKNGSISSLNKDAEEYLSICNKEQKSDKHALQVLYRLCGLTWRGEGYDLSYFPKNKTNKRKTGIAISNNALRQFVKNNLQLQMTEMYPVPMKQNLLRRIDEINRYLYIITDDLFTLHASVALRKNVEFLDTIGINTRIEFFGQGNYYRIYDGEWRL